VLILVPGGGMYSCVMSRSLLFGEGMLVTGGWFVGGGAWVVCWEGIVGGGDTFWGGFRWNRGIRF
jgi:hypothetical protein